MKSSVLKYLSPVILTAAFILFLASCSENTNNNVDCTTYDYSDCNTTEPFDGRLYVSLSINSENKAVPVIIYKGKLEDHDTIVVDTITTEKFDTLLPINNYYTVTAKYIKGGSTIIAVDGNKISKSKSYTCDSICWTVKTGSVNVKLK
jgi:hypothetical protein